MAKSFLLLAAALGGVIVLTPVPSMASGYNGMDPESSGGISAVSSTQQRNVIKGVVTDQESGDPLIGVTVTVSGTNTATVTDINGQFSIQAPANSTLVFTYVGMKTVKVATSGRTTLNVVMENEAYTLGNVEVYTGYMTQKKADLTGSVAIVDNQDIARSNSANVMKGLQGKVAGVYITTNGGNPAEDVSVQVRGLTSLSGAVKPLIVLDGFPTENLNLRDINTNDIESIQVLKDASSASIYGSRASGGVILIETKKGREGKMKIEYDGNISLNTVVKKPELMNAEQYGEAIFRAYAYDNEVYGTAMNLPSNYDFKWHYGDNGRPVLESVKPSEYLDNDHLVPGSDTDWLKEVLQTGLSTKHQVTVTAGNNRSRSMFSLGFLNNEGTQKYTFFRQYSARVNTEYELIDDVLKVGENIGLSYLQYNNQNETWFAMIDPPAMPVYDVNGNWAGAPGFDDFENPIRRLKLNQHNINNFVKIIGNVYLDLRILPGLRARTQFGVDYGNAYNRYVEGKWSETGGRNSNGENYVNNGQDHRLNYVWTNTLNYNLRKGVHDISAVLGQESTRYVAEGFSARREGIYLEDRDFAFLGMTTGSKYSLGSDADEYTYLSFFGKVNYSYDNKYLASFTIRRDGSSLFGSNNRWGTFPAFSLGWRVTQEPFMKKLDWLTNLKVRLSWGQNGSVQGLPRGYTTTPFTTNYFDTSYPIEGNETGHLASGYRRLWLGNHDLKWETTSQWDLGLDFGLFNQRLTGSFEYYYKKTKNILVQTPYIAAMGEGGEPWLNGASMNNRGVELQLTYTNGPSAPFHYTISLNIGTYKTKLTELPSNVINKYPGDGMRDFVLGKTPNILYGMVADGIFKTQEEVDNHAQQSGKAVGRIRYKDLDGDGVINELYDRTFIGITDPDCYGGLNVDLAYKGFDMNIFFQGVFGNKVNNKWKMESDFWNLTQPEDKNHPTRLLKAWSFDNPNSDIPAISNQTVNNENIFSSYYVEDGSYLKLRSLELGYTLPKSIISRIKMERLRFYVNLHNVFTLKKSWGADKYTSFDPEMPGYGYLQPFTITFGVNVAF